MKYYIIADTHFCHRKIIEYCDRPFKSIEEMNRTLIENWNRTVSKKDTVFHLGDVGLGPREELTKIIYQLQGRIILIKGNHDTRGDDYYRSMGFDSVSSFPILFQNKYLMSHKPIEENKRSPYFHFYGHVHNNNGYDETSNSKCVCVERIGYKPYLFLRT